LLIPSPRRKPVQHTSSRVHGFRAYWLFSAGVPTSADEPPPQYRMICVCFRHRCSISRSDDALARCTAPGKMALAHHCLAHIHQKKFLPRFDSSFYAPTLFPSLSFSLLDEFRNCGRGPWKNSFQAWIGMRAEDNTDADGIFPIRPGCCGTGEGR